MGPKSTSTGVKAKKKKMLVIMNELNKTISSIHLEPIYDAEIKRKESILFLKK
jgi:hypothetical protein